MENKKLLVLQFRTDASLEHEQQCVERHSGMKHSDIMYYNALVKDNDGDYILNLIKEMNCPVIIGGSGEFYISKPNKTKEIDEKIKAMIEKMRPIVTYLLENDIPTLGLCFGHQLIAYIQGATLGHKEEQRETGAFEITLNEKCNEDGVFGDLPKSFKAILGHQDSVEGVPAGSELLGSSERCMVQALRYGNNIYTTQFHPELDLDDLKERMALYPHYIQEGSDEKDLEGPDQCVTSILKNFKEKYIQE